MIYSGAWKKKLGFRAKFPEIRPNFYLDITFFYQTNFGGAEFFFRHNFAKSIFFIPVPHKWSPAGPNFFLDITPTWPFGTASRAAQFFFRHNFSPETQQGRIFF